MRSDVPVGITLSGGVDSSSIACLLRTFCREPLETFTASYPGEAFDEAPQAGALSQSLGMHSNPIPAEPRELLPTLRKIIRHLKAPIHTPAVLPLWNIMQAARQKVTVLLEGQAPTSSWPAITPTSSPPLPIGWRHRRPWAAVSELAWEFRRVGLRRSVLLAGRAVGPAWTHTLFRRVRGDELVSLRPLATRAAKPVLRDDLPATSDKLNASLMRQHEGRLVDLLHYGDAISMAHSIESRLPFLDHRLVEYCFRLPGRLKYEARARQGSAQRRCAATCRRRFSTRGKKLGFVVPILRWFRERPGDGLSNPEIRQVPPARLSIRPGSMPPSKSIAPARPICRTTFIAGS